MIDILQEISYKGVRKAIGDRMEISGGYPMTYQGIYVDITDLLAFRKQINEEKNVRLTVNDFIIRACSIALQKTPLMNSALNSDKTKIEVYKNCNISVMIDSKFGLMAPVIKRSEEKSIFEISEEMKVFAEKANAGKLMPDEYSNGTFALTNIGKMNSYDIIPLPMPPQPAILGVCTAQKKPVVVEKAGEDVIEIRMLMKIVVGGDHRILDGKPLAAFINDVKNALEAPETLVN